MDLQVVACPTCGKKNRVPAQAKGYPRCGNCHSALPWIAAADDATFAAIAEQVTVPVLVDLWAAWCGPCQVISPILETLARRFGGRLKLVKVDVDASPGTARRFDVQGIPTLVLLQGGRVVDRQIGAAPEPVLRQWLDNALSAIKPGA